MFHGMKLYTVHTKAGSDHTLTKPVFLREGFSFYAFAFTFAWAFYHRLWLFGVLLLAFNFAAGAMLEYGFLNEIQAVIVQLAMQFLVGLHGNDMLRRRMQRQGYIFQDITSGDSLLRAEQRYFDRLVAQA